MCNNENTGFVYKPTNANERVFRHGPGVKARNGTLEMIPRETMVFFIDHGVEICSPEYKLDLPEPYHDLFDEREWRTYFYVGKY